MSEFDSSLEISIFFSNSNEFLFFPSLLHSSLKLRFQFEFRPVLTETEILMSYFLVFFFIIIVNYKNSQ